ncbi:MAG: YncE family protein [Sandaracinaceae bacterium]|nr:YncE family protein [Sandaracinaceae bacterium]
MSARLSIGSLLVVLAVASIGLAQERGGHADARPAQRARIFRTERGGPELSVTTRVRTGVQPKSVNVSPDGTRVVVCNFGRPDRDNVFVYDSESLAHVGTISFPGNAVETVFTHDGRTLYVSNFRENVVEVVDFGACYGASAAAPCTLTPRATISTGSLPKFMALSPDDSTLYVANWGDRSVSVVDVATLHETRRLHTERHPRGMVVRPDGTLLAAAFHGDVVHVFPRGASEESERFRMCELPRHLLLSPDGATMYVTCSMGHVGFYDSHTGARLGIGSLGRNPRSIAITADGRYIGAANFTSSDVSLVDTVDHTHRTIPVPGASRIVGLAMHPRSSPIRLYATSWDTNELILLTSTAR